MRDTPKKYGWLIYMFIYVYFMETPIYKWMMTGGTPISGNLLISMGTMGMDQNAGSSHPFFVG